MQASMYNLNIAQDLPPGHEGTSFKDIVPPDAFGMLPLEGSGFENEVPEPNDEDEANA